MDVDLIMYLLVELVENRLCSSEFSICSNWEVRHGGTIREINKDGGLVFENLIQENENGHVCLCLRLITKSQDISGRHLPSLKAWPTAVLLRDGGVLP